MTRSDQVGTVCAQDDRALADAVEEITRTIEAGDPVATVVPDGRHFAVARFAASDAVGRLRVGQSAQIRLDGYSWAQFGTVAATVARLAPQTREHSRRVELEILEVPAGIALEHGFPGEVVVDVESISPMVAVLREAGAQLGAERPPAAAPAPPRRHTSGTARASRRACNRPDASSAETRPPE